MYKRQEGGNAETVTLNGKVVGVANVGQRFTQDIYFWGRPSCAGDGYDGTSSAGSNKGVTNESYLKEVEARIDTFLLHHPYLKRAEVPAEMVTASASGLDPDITPACAYVDKTGSYCQGIERKRSESTGGKPYRKTAFRRFRAFQNQCIETVSYTHLTLPTIA